MDDCSGNLRLEPIATSNLTLAPEPSETTPSPDGAKGVLLRAARRAGTTGLVGVGSQIDGTISPGNVLVARKASANPGQSRKGLSSAACTRPGDHAKTI